MEFNYAYNKPNSFFKGKQATVNQTLKNSGGEIIEKNSDVVIIGKTIGFKTFFDIKTDKGVYMNCISHELLEFSLKKKPNESIRKINYKY